MATAPAQAPVPREATFVVRPGEALILSSDGPVARRVESLDDGLDRLLDLDRTR